MLVSVVRQCPVNGVAQQPNDLARWLEVRVGKRLYRLDNFPEGSIPGRFDLLEGLWTAHQDSAQVEGVVIGQRDVGRLTAQGAPQFFQGTLLMRNKMRQQVF